MFRVVRGIRKWRSFRNSSASYQGGTTGPVLAFVAISGQRIWDMVHFSNFFLLGKLSCVAFGDFFEVASEVIMECFFNLERDHFDYLRSKRLGRAKPISTNSDSPRCFHRVPPPKESMKVFLENRRLLMSILVLEQFTMLLALHLGNLSCMLKGDRR